MSNCQMVISVVVLVVVGVIVVGVIDGFLFLFGVGCGAQPVNPESFSPTAWSELTATVSVVSHPNSIHGPQSE